MDHKHQYIPLLTTVVTFHYSFMGSLVEQRPLKYLFTEHDSGVIIYTNYNCGSTFLVSKI